ncbi:protein phosphatase CheZ [Oceaniserpentilla sp. 4NH20-0058]|uniref:protein phosphatase CheZ n=1 Tax=Oceaniserpentilla sp. 4NH20-0058 TaxID=3127660 RepID=UPI0031021805
MAEAELKNSTSEFAKLFSEKANELMGRLEQNDLAGAVGLIQDLQKVRDENLYQEIGQLTRALHESIKNFKLDSKVQGAGSDIDEAHEGLQYVVEMTAKAANKTMDKVDDSMPLSEAIASEAFEIRQEWTRFLNKEMSAKEFRELTKRVAQFLENTDKNTKKLNANLSDILLAQDFQDLTGQVIQRITTMVTDVEARLVNLVAMAGHVDQMTGIQHKEIVIQDKEHDPNKGVGPQLNAEENEDVASNQDDVDDLLSSLGF